MTRPELIESMSGARSTRELAGVVIEARERQRLRLAGTPWQLNSEVPGVELRKHWPVRDDGRALVDHQLRSLKLNARSADRILRLSWTLADLCGHDVPDADDVEAALSLRRGTALGGTMRDMVQA
jgi:magnesium chelatase family protein